MKKSKGWRADLDLSHSLPHYVVVKALTSPFLFNFNRAKKVKPENGGRLHRATDRGQFLLQARSL